MENHKQISSTKYKTDWTPPHYFRAVRQDLDKTFTPWNGKGDTIIWVYYMNSNQTVRAIKTGLIVDNGFWQFALSGIIIFMIDST